MRVIEKRARVIFESWPGRAKYHLGNTEIRRHTGIGKTDSYIDLYLFGNHIARRYKHNGAVYFTLAGWDTVTTRSRLKNVVGAYVYRDGGIPYCGCTQLSDSWWYYLCPITGDAKLVGKFATDTEEKERECDAHNAVKFE